MTQEVASEADTAGQIKLKQSSTRKPWNPNAVRRRVSALALWMARREGL